jgi:hypothetical protein
LVIGNLLHEGVLTTSRGAIAEGPERQTLPGT